MKWWVAGTAGAALILASVSVWLGFGAGVMKAKATDLLVAGSFIGALAWVLGMRIASQRRNRNRVMILALVCLVYYAMVGPNWIPEISQLLRPYCSQYNSSDICVQSAPLWVDIFDLVPIFLLPIAVLLSTFWPSKQNPVGAARQMVWPPQQR